MQHNFPDSSMLAYFAALGLTASHGCVNPQSIFNGDPQAGWPSEWTTRQAFINQWQTSKIHVFYCQRDEQVFNLEEDPNSCLIDYLTFGEQETWKGTQDELIQYFYEHLDDDDNVTDDFFTWEGHLIFIVKDI